MSEQNCILLVEDDELIRESMAGFLREEGYAVAEAANGKEALEWLRSHPAPCLILLDLFMPVMGGEDFRARQVQDPQLAGIPVIVVSAIDGPRVAGLGAQGYLQKPFKIEKLLSYVEHHC